MNLSKKSYHLIILYINVHINHSNSNICGSTTTYLFYINERMKYRKYTKYRIVKNVEKYTTSTIIKKYRSVILTKNFMLKQKLLSLAKQLTLLQDKTEADLMTMMMGVMRIKKFSDFAIRGPAKPHHM